MTKVSIYSKLNSYVAENPALKSLPPATIISVMVEKGVLTKTEGESLAKSISEGGAKESATGGAKKTIDVIPQWSTKTSNLSEPEQTALSFLESTLSEGETSFARQENSSGGFSYLVNLSKEIFRTENRKSNLEKNITDTKSDLEHLKQSASAVSGIDFKDEFKRVRGVEFSATNIKNCTTLSKEMTGVQAAKDTCDNLKASLINATVNNVSNSNLKDANNAILKTFNVLGVKNKNEINAVLKDIEKENSENPEIKKYGGDFRIAKNKQGKYTIYRTAKNGFPAEATAEELQIIAKEMTFRLNKAYGAAIGVEMPRNATNEELEELTAAKYEETKTKYEDAFQKAYGKKNVKTLSENYIQSQKEGVAYLEMTVNMVSLATMFTGSGLVTKGLGIVSKNANMLNAAAKTTQIASKATPALVAAQITQPVRLIENLTAKEPDWKSYGMSVAEGSMWMALGMATGGVGDKARMLLGQKGLSAIAKTTGKSVDELINLYKSGHKLPANLSKALSLVENTSKVSGTTAEFTADILATYAIQKGIKGENLTATDYFFSANGAVLGTVMHKSFARISEKEKLKTIERGLLQNNPNMTKPELTKAGQDFLEISKIAEEKHAGKVDETPVKTSKTEIVKPELTAKDTHGNLMLSDAGEQKVRQSAKEINLSAKNEEAAIVSYMEKFGLGMDKETMVHRVKSEQSLYDKIKNAMLDNKSPATLKEAIKSVKDGIGTRTQLQDFDYKKHPDIMELAKTDKKAAIALAAERQSQEYVDKVKEIIKLQATGESPIAAVRLSNYKGKDGISYFSDRQIAILRDFAAERNIDFHLNDKLTKERPSGYTAFQMNFTTKEGFTYEWQLRGSKVNIFAECEHVPYDLRENKDVTGGKAILKNLYKPMETIIKNLNETEFKNYNKYLTAHYEHLRNLELGFESKEPNLQDFGNFDSRMSAKNLELLHELSDGLKNGKISEQNALLKYEKETNPIGSRPTRRNSRTLLHKRQKQEIDV